MVTFAVSPVEASDKPLGPTRARPFIEALLGGPIESCSQSFTMADVAPYHPLIAAAEEAFSRHYPLVLSPDMLWITILQGVAQHVHANAEAFRNQLVAHDGKVELRVVRNDFVKGSFENPWPEVFDDLVEQMRSYLVPGVHDRMSARFSTTGPVEVAAGQVALMDCMQAYFEYTCYSMCGIPFVTLEGTPDDWDLLYTKTQGLQSMIPRWIDRLLPVLEQFGRAARWDVDVKFWQSLYKRESMSGGDYMSGWLLLFLPYLKRGGENQLVWTDRDGSGFDGIQTDQLPSSLSAAPFRWEYLGTPYAMQFVAGLVGVEQEGKTGSVRPRVGWAVREMLTPAQANGQRFVRWLEELASGRPIPVDWLGTQAKQRFELSSEDLEEVLVSAGYRMQQNAWVRD